ncbi:MAG: hypothetical protein KGI60_01555 [Patescibacteria group bacterium]|nr:hypothetical protein [Patescibacteria group bacterium]
MEEKKVVPPDEREWDEQKNHYTKDHFEGVVFYELRGYFHPQKKDEGLVVLDFLEAGVCLKVHMFGANKNDQRRYTARVIYLQLSDGRWVKAVEGTDYSIDLQTEERDKGTFLRVILEVKTSYGSRRRIVRKKL